MSWPRHLLSTPILLVLLASCASSPPVSFNESWPGEPRDYQDATDDWTRTGKIIATYNLVARVHATFKSPEWRVAHIAERRQTAALSAEQHGQLVAEHKRALAEHHEFELLVATHEPRDNDLDRGARSSWNLTLLNDRGETVAAAKIERDRRPAATIRAQFPAMGDFDRAYIVRFPRTLDLMYESASRFTLRMAGERGRIDLVWRSK